MNGLSDFVRVLMFEGIADAGVEGDLLGCDTLLNLRDFKSKALVLGSGTALDFDGEAEGAPEVGVDTRAVFASTAGVSFVNLFFNEVLGAPLMRRFLWRR